MELIKRVQFTKEQLIEAAQEDIAAISDALQCYMPCAASKSLQKSLVLKEIALASLNAKPIGAFHILDAVIAGQKKAELRRNDRNYKVGDVLSLKEWKHGKYTGREWSAVITHVLPINEVVAGFESWVVLSINSMSLFDVAAYLYNNGGLFQLQAGAKHGR